MQSKGVFLSACRKFRQGRGEGRNTTVHDREIDRGILEERNLVLQLLIITYST